MSIEDGGVPLDNAGFSDSFPSYDHNPHTKRSRKKNDLLTQYVDQGNYEG